MKAPCSTFYGLLTIPLLSAQKAEHVRILGNARRKPRLAQSIILAHIKNKSQAKVV